MYGLRRLHSKFNSELNRLEVILDDLSTSSKSFKRDVFINGTFLRVVIIWENFIEESFLAAMCKCKTIDGTILKPRNSASRNKEDAFKKLNINRKLRESEYLDWIDAKKLKHRIEDIFHHRSRFHKIYRDENLLNQIKVIRNHIAHNSKNTEKKFRNHFIRFVGYLALPDPNAADILISTNRSNGNKFYKNYIDYYIDNSDILCK